VSSQSSRTDDLAELARVRGSLLAWYAVEQRDFPWRRTRDPWAVLVSEVMLQQTQASRIAERFPAFLAHFPTAAAMAATSEAEVLTAWSGLGYNRRAISLRRAALALVANGWPTDVAGLSGLPGVGRYTARAVASLAFGRPEGVVDTNVRRWLVRRFGRPPEAAPAALQALADRLARPGGDAAVVAAWTHATMEFGARVCTSRAPRCDDCPIANGCPARGRAVAVPVPRQASFAGSRRALRGELLRRLVTGPADGLSLVAARRALPGLDRRAFRIVTDGLQRDGLAHRSGRRLRLGGRRAAGDGATTIGP
jgi:A/G-specific adenine glycosylase